MKSRTDDAFLLRFLRARKFDYDRAYNLLVNYYTIRASNADIIGQITPSSVEHVYDSGTVAMLPYRDKEGRKILYFNSGEFPTLDLYTKCTYFYSSVRTKTSRQR